MNQKYNILYAAMLGLGFGLTVSVSSLAETKNTTDTNNTIDSASIAESLNSTAMEKSQTAEAMEKNQEMLSSLEDGEWVTVTGTVKDIDGHDFILKNNNGEVEVELEGWNWNKPDLEKVLKIGEQVTVTGQVDKDWFDDREIEASNIYLNDRYVYYYTESTSTPEYLVTYQRQLDRKSELGRGDSTAATGNEAAADVADKSNKNQLSSAKDGAYLSLSGEVHSIDGKDFTLSYNGQKIKVDVSDLGSQVIDSDGRLTLRKGDRIFVYGEVDDDLFSKKEIDAEILVFMSNANDKDFRAASL